MNVELPKRIYQSRPDLILNIDNEYMTFLMMDELRSKSFPLQVTYLDFASRVLREQCRSDAQETLPQQVCP